LKSLNHNFSIEEVGHSTLGRSINLVKWGKGPKKVFLWSQMHGDEATATMALFDLMNFFELDGEFKEINELLNKK
jgi:predicted deacylase